MVSIHAPLPRGARNGAHCANIGTASFNPRPAEGNLAEDVYNAGYVEFQSTPPRGGRPQ